MGIENQIEFGGGTAVEGQEDRLAKLENEINALEGYQIWTEDSGLPLYEELKDRVLSNPDLPVEISQKVGELVGMMEDLRKIVRRAVSDRNAEKMVLKG